jgi:transposase-like protein
MPGPESLAATILRPADLRQAVQHFGDYERCKAIIEWIRWPRGVTCPTCGSTRVAYLANVRRYKCYGVHTRAQFSLKVGTVFQNSPVALEKWLAALWAYVNSAEGVSSRTLARALGVTQKTAWSMVSRLAEYQRRGGPTERATALVAGRLFPDANAQGYVGEPVSADPDVAMQRFLAALARVLSVGGRAELQAQSAESAAVRARPAEPRLGAAKVTLLHHNAPGVTLDRGRNAD